MIRVNRLMNCSKTIEALSEEEKKYIYEVPKEYKTWLIFLIIFFFVFFTTLTLSTLPYVPKQKKNEKEFNKK